MIRFGDRSFLPLGIEAGADRPPPPSFAPAHGATDPLPLALSRRTSALHRWPWLSGSPVADGRPVGLPSSPEADVSCRLLCGIPVPDTIDRLRLQRTCRPTPRPFLRRWQQARSGRHRGAQGKPGGGAGSPFLGDVDRPQGLLSKEDISEAVTDLPPRPVAGGSSRRRSRSMALRPASSFRETAADHERLSEDRGS
jgi:hypothetical protein